MLNCVGAHRDSHQEVNKVVEQPAGLKSKWTELRPGERVEFHSQRDVDRRREADQICEEPDGLVGQACEEASYSFSPLWCGKVQPRGNAIECQEQPDEPCRTRGPDAEREPL